MSIDPKHPENTPPEKQRLVKATFYLSQEHITKLEEYRLKLIKRGERVDKSELVRRAIDLLVQE